MFSNDEEDLFNPSSGSNLASLFGTTMSLQRDSNASLVYTPPKQPKTGGQETPKPTPRSSTPQSSVICTKFLEAFKFLDDNYVPIGKCGIAIIGNEALKTFEVILYRTKQDILSRSRLRQDLIFTIQSNDFLSFCDDQKVQWTVLFSDIEALKEFVEQIKIHNGTIATNSTKQEAICDKKISPTNAIKSEPTISPDSPSATQRDSDSSDSNSKTRANILSRMAKMGQPILPVNPPKPTKQSDSETDEQTVNRKPIKKKQKFVIVNGEYVPSDKVKNLNSNNVQTAPEFLALNGQIVPISALQQNLATQVQPSLSNQYLTSLPNQVVLTTQQPPQLSDSLHVFIAENRTHNCELRMNMNHLSSKLDNILLKLNNKDNQAEIPNKNELELRILEKTKELEANENIIRDLQEEKQKLQDHINDDNPIINNLKKENQDLKDAILDLEQKISELEKSKSDLEGDLQSKIQENKREAEQTINELKQIVEDQKIKIENLELAKCHKEKEVEQQNLESTITMLNNDISCLRTQLDDKNSKADLFAGKLKQSMNSLYQGIMENFDDDTATFQSMQIKQILSQKLKSVTLQIIQEFQNDFKNSDQ